MSDEEPGSDRGQSVDPKLLEILVCPATQGPLRYDRDAQELISETAGLAYPIREGIPIMLIDEMSKGASFKDALHISIEKLDGCFTYIAVTDDCFALVKDAYAAKPLVVAETDELVALSSDPQSLREGVLADMDVWEPGAGEVHIWQM